MSYESGLHVFEIKWPTKQRGTHPVIGVSTGKGTFVNDVTQVRDGVRYFVKRCRSNSNISMTVGRGV